MISTTRRWLRRNRTSVAIGAGVVGVGYIAGQYILSKIVDARERMSSDRIAKENLRRRFQQNQEDCTFTVLALLPTAAENVLEALPVERITNELQQRKGDRLGRSGATPSDLSSGPPSVTDEDGKSLASFQSESYVHASQMGASSAGEGEPALQRPLKTKVQLWNELKISSITRTFTLLYTLSLLTLLTRIQLNLLGRRNYLSSVVSLASHPLQDSTISLENHDDDNVEQSYGNDFETNRKFLTFSWWLLHRGWRDMMEKVESAVNEVFGPLNPREDVSIERLSGLILDVRRKVEGATPEERRTRKWLSYVLPPPDQEDFVLQASGMSSGGTPPPVPQSEPEPQETTTLIPSPPTSPAASSSPLPSPQSPALRRLLNETSDLVDSPPFTHILTLLLDTTFSHLTDQKIRLQAFKLPSPSSLTSASRIEDVTDSPETTTKLATILAVVTRQAHAISNGVPNEYVQAMENVSELEAFAAVVYSSYFEGEGVIPDVEVEGLVREESSTEEADEGDERTVMKDSEEGSNEARGLLGDVAGGFENVWAKVLGR